jgi:hypothetical protein
MLHHFTPLPVAGLFGISVSEIVTLFIPIAGMILGGIMGVTAMYFSHQQRRQWHETARLALEKGQPVPPPPSGKIPGGAPASSERNDIRTGLILVAVGFGLFLFFKGLDARAVAQIGAIPGCIGGALLLYGLFAPKKSVAPTRPPQS